VDDEPGIRESFRLILEDDYEILEAATGAEALETVRTTQVDLALLDIRLPDLDGIEVLERLKALDEGIEVVLVTAVQTVRTAVAAMKLGAFDYVTKPFEDEAIAALVRRAVDKRALDREVTYLREELARHHGFDELVGRHPAMQRLFQLVATVARTPVTVLIVGESGTGKELVARAIHRQSPQRDGPFVPINVAALPETVIESELFGHERGAFTGAFQRKLGKFELAQGGTLFLDEIATLRVNLQAKILRALQEREIERVGGTRRIRVDARVIAATNADLRGAVKAGTVREDLYYRLNVVEIRVPPLRERREDVPLLVEHFLRRYARDFHKPVAGIAESVMAVLREYPWPGNVRELQNVVERAVAVGEGPLVELRDLPLDLLLPRSSGQGPRPERLSLREARDQFERQLILRVLERTGWNQAEAARALGLHRSSFRLRLEALGIQVPEAR
jgi:two-component system response regulator AtoC